MPNIVCIQSSLAHVLRYFIKQEMSYIKLSTIARIRKNFPVLYPLPLGRMQRLVVLVLMLLRLARGDLRIFPILYGRTLNITCEYEASTWKDLQNILSIVVTKYTNTEEDQQVEFLSSVNVFKFTKNNITDAVLSGQVGATGYSVVSLHWKTVTSPVDGYYKCTLHGMDYDNVPLSMTTDMTLRLQDLDPVITVSPGHIEEDLTTSLVLECSNVNFAIHGIIEVLQVTITHNKDGVSELIFSSQNDVLNSEWRAVNSFRKFSSWGFYYAISKAYPTLKDSGTYTCDVTARNSSSHSLKIVKITNVTASTRRKQKVYESFCPLDGLEDYIILSCNFENGLCGLNLSTSSSGTGWRVIQSRVSAAPLPRSTRDASGHVLQLFSSGGQSDTAYVESKVFHPKGRQICISFWYIQVKRCQGLSVYTKTVNGDLEKKVAFSENHYFVTPWTKVKSVFPSPALPFVMGIVPTSDIHHYNTNECMVIDDLIIYDLDCE